MKKNRKIWVLALACGLVFGAGPALAGNGASDNGDRDRLQDGSCISPDRAEQNSFPLTADGYGDQERDQDRLQDGSCIFDG